MGVTTSPQKSLFFFILGTLIIGMSFSSKSRGQAALLDESIYGQISNPGKLRFEHLSLNEGLSQSSIHSILQDKQGFLWFGTEDGLNRYDGYSFKIFKPDPNDPNNLSDPWVNTIYQDDNGHLWVGTRLGGLNLYDPQTGQFTHFQHDPKSPQSLSNNNIQSILRDLSGVLWIGTIQGLNQYIPETGQFIRYQNDPKDPDSLGNDQVNVIYEDRAGDVWIGTANGLDRLDRQTFQFIHYRNDPREANSLTNNYVQSIYQDKSGDLWVGTGQGLDRINLESGKFEHYLYGSLETNSLSNNGVLSIYQDREGVLWVGTQNGLNQFNPATGQFIHFFHDPNDPNSLSSSTIFSIFEDQGSVLWFGTFGGGLNKYDRGKAKFALYQNDPGVRNSLSNNTVFQIHEDRTGTIWIATYGGGLNRFEPSTGLITYYRHHAGNPSSLSSDQVWSVYEDWQGVLWVGTQVGLDRFIRGTSQFKHYYHDPDDPHSLGGFGVYYILEDHSGTLWVGTDMGLDWLDRSTNQFGHYKNDPKNPFSLSGNEVITLHEDRGGELWIGTFNNGLNRLDRQTGQFKHYQHNPDDPTSLSNNSILSIYQDLAGVLWIGTAGGGLNKFDSQTESFIHYTQKDGLPNDVVYGILEDDQGYLWLSTNHGLSRFDQRAETFNNYDAGDGLQSNEFNMNSYVKTRNGVMFFGGVNGLNTFSPKEISDSSYLPPVVLTSLTQDGKVVNQGQPPEMIDSFTLRWPQNSFDFEFAALSYAQPEENQYAYMLEGFDENWIEMATRRFGRYTSLPGGKYILKIKGASNNGIWNEEGLSIQVNVIPPMWETWWFRGAGALLLVGIIFGASRLRVKRIQAHNRDLEKLIGERTRSLEARTLEAEQNRQELDALYRAEEKMYRHVHLDEVLQALVDVTVGNLQADKSAVLAWDERREQWVIRVARGFSPEAMAIISFARGEGIIGYVTESGEGIILEDVATDPQRQNERPENVQALLDEGIQSLIYLPIKIGDEVFGIFNVSFVRAHAFGQDEQKLFTALVKRAALAIENARLFDAEQRRVEQFRVIAEVSHRFTLTLDINDLLNQVVRLIQQTFNYYHVGIGLIEGQEIVYRVGAGGLWDNMQFKYKPGRLRLGQEGLSGWVGAHGEPLLVQDVSHDPRYVWMEGSQTRSEMVVPITVKEETIGVLDVQSDELNAFDERDLIVIQSLANQVGAAIENARLYIQAKDLAIMEERSRLARDLHDSAKQKAFAALAQLGAAGSHLKNDPSDAKGHLTEAENLVYEVIQELTFLIQEMYPLALKEKGLVTVLREYIFEWENRNNIKVDLKVEGAQQLSLQVEQTLYRISQEALANIARHSQASKVEISVCYKADCVELVVSDNGKGFDVTKKTQNGLGLISMRERVKTIGGSIAIESSPGTGTRVSVSVPFEIDT